MRAWQRLIARLDKDMASLINNRWDEREIAKNNLTLSQRCLDLRCRRGSRHDRHYLGGSNARESDVWGFVFVVSSLSISRFIATASRRMFVFSNVLAANEQHLNSLTHSKWSTIQRVKNASTS